MSYTLPYAREMTSRVTPQMVEAIVAHFGKQTTAAVRLGVSQPTVSRWMKGSQPEPDQAERIFQTLADIGLGPGDIPDTVPLLGYVGAGAAVAAFADGQGELERVPAPERSTLDTVAAEIRGASLGELFDTWLVFYDDVRRPFTDDLLRHVCIVGLPDGRVLIKKVIRGQLPQHFTLISNTEPPIYDIQIEWAAKIIDMRPRA